VHQHVEDIRRSRYRIDVEGVAVIIGWNRAISGGIAIRKRLEQDFIDGRVDHGERAEAHGKGCQAAAKNNGFCRNGRVTSSISRPQFASAPPRFRFGDEQSGVRDAVVIAAAANRARLPRVPARPG
jgi:hypothetical protein